MPILKGRHDIDANYDLLEAHLDRPFERNYDTWVALRNDAYVVNRWGLHRNEYVCLQPGAANGAANSTANGHRAHDVLGADADEPLIDDDANAPLVDDDADGPLVDDDADGPLVDDDSVDANEPSGDEDSQ